MSTSNLPAGVTLRQIDALDQDASCCGIKRELAISYRCENPDCRYHHEAFDVPAQEKNFGIVAMNWPRPIDCLNKCEAECERVAVKCTNCGAEVEQ